MKLLDTIYESTLLEYSHKVVNQLVDKFTEQGINPERVREYISLFHRYSQGLDSDKRDITKYSWNELYKIVNHKKENKRIKAGKIGDRNVDKDDIVYNNDGIRIFKADSKEQCIRYGNGYNFCISSRGEDNKYDYYHEEYNIGPYFIFNDNLPLDDKRHLLVLYIIRSGDIFGVGVYPFYQIWDTLNKGSLKFKSYNEVINFYPWLEGLESIFVD
jgi:hypothetical protein